MTPVPRSWLFVPGDSERKQARALGSGADAIILDLEDSVAPQERPAARRRCAALLGAHPEAPLWVRVNAPASAELAADFEALASQPLPRGIVVPKVSDPAELLTLAARLQALESGQGEPAGSVRLLVVATETPLAVLNLPQYPKALAAAPATLARLTGLTWGLEDLSAALGALRKRDPGGELPPTFQLVRSVCLLTAAALGVAAIDGIHADFRDAAGLSRALEAARGDGFSGKLAVHPDQVAPINGAFTPSEAECAQARRIVAAFAAAGGAGVTSLDGTMLDRPHLLLAQRTLARAGEGR
ncbi:MAG: CoA ester lyase [Gammaproteobacteria bacterium]|nr:CoA ester lyase [Gammaproteobacteria bacterium]